MTCWNCSARWRRARSSAPRAAGSSRSAPEDSFSLLGLPREFALDAARARARASASARAALHPDRFAARRAARAAPLARARRPRLNDAYRVLKDCRRRGRLPAASSPGIDVVRRGRATYARSRSSSRSCSSGARRSALARGRRRRRRGSRAHRGATPASGCARARGRGGRAASRTSAGARDLPVRHRAGASPARATTTTIVADAERDVSAAVRRSTTRSKPMARAVGIDLGTTNSLVAARRRAATGRTCLPADEGAAAAPLGGALRARTAPSWSARGAQRRAPERPQDTIALGEALHGARARRRAAARTAGIYRFDEGGRGGAASRSRAARRGDARSRSPPRSCAR